MALFQSITAKQKQIKKQVEEYLEWCEFGPKRMTPTTMKCKKVSLNKFLRETGCADFRRLTNYELEDWHMSMAKAGYTGKTINNTKDHVVSCLRFLHRRGYRLKIDFSRIERAEEKKKEAYYFDREEIELIKSFCEGPRERLLISLVLDSGLRIDELSRLRIDSIKGTEIMVKNGKGGKDRVTFMLEPTRELLTKWLSMNGIEEGYIFPSPTKFNEPLSIQQIRMTINGPIRRAGFAKGSAHTVRHTFATQLIDGGAGEFEAQTLLGHTDPKTTRRYYHVSLQKLRLKHKKALTVTT